MMNKKFLLILIVLSFLKLGYPIENRVMQSRDLLLEIYNFMQPSAISSLSQVSKETYVTGNILRKKSEDGIQLRLSNNRIVWKFVQENFTSNSEIYSINSISSALYNARPENFRMIKSFVLKSFYKEFNYILNNGQNDGQTRALYKLVLKYRNNILFYPPNKVSIERLSQFMVNLTLWNNINFCLWDHIRNTVQKNIDTQDWREVRSDFKDQVEFHGWNQNFWFHFWEQSKRQIDNRFCNEVRSEIIDQLREQVMPQMKNETAQEIDRVLSYLGHDFLYDTDSLHRLLEMPIDFIIAIYQLDSMLETYSPEYKNIVKQVDLFLREEVGEVEAQIILNNIQLPNESDHLLKKIFVENLKLVKSN